MRIQPFSNHVQYIPKDGKERQVSPADWYVVTETDIALMQSGSGPSTVNISDPENPPSGGDGGGSTSLEDLVPVINNVTPTENTIIQLEEPTILDYVLTITAGTNIADPLLLQYQWQLKDSGTNSWVDIAGANSTTYSIPAGMSVANDDGDSYRCEITHGATVVNAPQYTGEFLIEVRRAIAITTQPALTSPAVAGNTITLDLVAAISSDVINYQWQIKENNTNSWEDIVDANGVMVYVSGTGVDARYTATFTTSVLDTYEDNGDQYRCVLTNPLANTITSSIVTLIVDGADFRVVPPIYQVTIDGIAKTTEFWSLERDGALILDPASSNSYTVTSLDSRRTRFLSDLWGQGACASKGGYTKAGVPILPTESVFVVLNGGKGFTTSSTSGSSAEAGGGYAGIFEGNILSQSKALAIAGGAGGGTGGAFGSSEGQELYDTPGYHSWTVPAGVISCCVVCVGAGGRGGGAGGGGGGLGWKNNISVIPGQTYLVVVGSPGQAGGANGGDSYFINTSTVKGGGGVNGWNGATGGSYVGNGGGSGGTGSSATNWGGGGGGAGGYSGNGGNASTLFGSAGSGGGGGGGAGHSNTGTNAGKRKGGGGGGVGVYGQGNNGSGAPSTGSGGDGGYGGSGGEDGDQSGWHEGGDGGAYGGGSGGTNEGGGWAAGGYGGVPGKGAVRIIWGPGRSFPSTLTVDQAPSAGYGCNIAGGAGGGLIAGDGNDLDASITGGDGGTQSAGGAGGVASGAAAATTFNQTYNSTNTVEIPAGISTVKYTIHGAKGGNGGNSSVMQGGSGFSSQNGGTGGQGQKISGVLTNVSGQTLTLEVGGNGGNGTGSQGNDTGGYGGYGYYSGGPGGSTSGGQETWGTDASAGGGGSATVIRMGSTVLAVAGGGGGGGGAAANTFYTATPGTTSNIIVTSISVGSTQGWSGGNGTSANGGTGGGGGGAFGGYGGGWNQSGNHQSGAGGGGGGGYYNQEYHATSDLETSTSNTPYITIEYEIMGEHGQDGTALIGGDGGGFVNAVGQSNFLSPGTHYWTCPNSVYRVSAVCIGGGGHGWGNTTNSITPGGGGGLGWKNDIMVVPGQTYTIVVGAAGYGGGDSYFIDTSTVKGGGGYGLGGAGGFVGDGGGNGGQGIGVWGGGGAGGYTGDGGQGGYSTFSNYPTAGSGGGGSGGGGISFPAAGGGGVGIYGKGADGAAGGLNLNGGSGGSGGSGGGSGGSDGGGNGGIYGGGAGVGSTDKPGGYGGNGAVRLIWGKGRSYPSTLTTDQTTVTVTTSGGTSGAGGGGGYWGGGGAASGSSGSSAGGGGSGYVASTVNGTTGSFANETHLNRGTAGEESQNSRVVINPTYIEITSNPESSLVNDGDTITFSVSALVVNGDGDPVTFQWQKKISGIWTDIAGAISATYTTPTLTIANTNEFYRCVLSNQYCADKNSEEVITLVAAPLETDFVITNPGSTNIPIPSSASEFTFKIWGAGGSGVGEGFPVRGGSGGFAMGTISIPDSNTNAITVFVGATGLGSPSGMSGYGAGRGGQRSEMIFGNNVVYVGGGGGTGQAGNGGFGGGASRVGGAGDGTFSPGGGGTLGGPGQGNGVPTSGRNGGGAGGGFPYNTGNRGGGGGSGYWGGGGGGGGNGTTGQSGGGGGGSGYIVANVTNYNTSDGSKGSHPYTPAPYSTDPDYVTGHGGSGENGLAVIKFLLEDQLVMTGLTSSTTSDISTLSSTLTLTENVLLSPLDGDYDVVVKCRGGSPSGTGAYVQGTIRMTSGNIYRLYYDSDYAAVFFGTNNIGNKCIMLGAQGGAQGNGVYGGVGAGGNAGYPSGNAGSNLNASGGGGGGTTSGYRSGSGGGGGYPGASDGYTGSWGGNGGFLSRGHGGNGVDGSGGKGGMGYYGGGGGGGGWDLEYNAGGEFGGGGGGGSSYYGGLPKPSINSYSPAEVIVSNPSAGNESGGVQIQIISVTAV